MHSHIVDSDRIYTVQLRCDSPPAGSWGILKDSFDFCNIVEAIILGSADSFANLVFARKQARPKTRWTDDIVQYLLSIGRQSEQLWSPTTETPKEWDALGNDYVTGSWQNNAFAK